MKFTINKIVYNVFEEHPNTEKAAIGLTAKLGVSREDPSKRAFFIELNIDCKDGESDIETRNLLVVANLNYNLDKNVFKDLNENEIDEDNKYFIKLLERLNEAIKNITSQDDVGRPLDINKAIEKHSNEGEKQL
ncbi:hypothetical protein [Lysinibacillus sp. NPDC096212]|uniref:hypothetical protein n=1 Tax=Lysinibacillus sp. NPDC096212 TaxID=3364135 RepID=UPI003812778A